MEDPLSPCSSEVMLGGADLAAMDEEDKKCPANWNVMVLVGVEDLLDAILAVPMDWG